MAKPRKKRPPKRPSADAPRQNADPARPPIPNEHAARLRTLATVLNVVCALGALAFVSYQTHLSNRATAAQVWQGVNQQFSALTIAFIDHPHLRPYFYDGQPVTRDDRNFNQVMALADAHLDFIETIGDNYIRAQDGMESEGEFWKIWEGYFRDLFALSPAVCTRAREIQKWYSTDFGPYAVRCTEHRPLVAPESSTSAPQPTGEGNQ